LGLTASHIFYLLESTLRTNVVTFLNCLTFTNLLVETLEPATWLVKQLMWLAILDKRTFTHYNNLIEVQYRVESVCDDDDSV
jgi:hypothetical protein